MKTAGASGGRIKQALIPDLFLMARWLRTSKADQWPFTKLCECHFPASHTSSRIKMDGEHAHTHEQSVTRNKQFPITEQFVFSEDIDPNLTALAAV
jgi:hypothetical protein